MDATLMFSAPATPPTASTRNASATVGGIGQAVKGTEPANDSSAAQNTPHGRIFAGLMRGLLPTHERQDVAAAPETAATEPGDLKTEVLGEQINVITTSNAQPDPNSLTAFARAQGLDEAAVKALFGEMAAQTVSAAAAADLAGLAQQLSAEIAIQVSEFKSAPNAAATASMVAASWSAAPVNADATVSSVMGWNMMANGQPLITPTLSVSSVSTGPAIEATPLSVTPPSFSGWGSTLPLTSAPLTSAPLMPPSLMPASSSPTSAWVPSGAMGALVPAAPLAVTAPVLSQPGLNAPVEAAEALNPLAPTVAMPEDALRIRLVPAWSVVTQQLTQMSGTALTSAWGALTATTLGAPIRSVALDLSTPLASDSHERGDWSGLDSGWGTQGSELNRPSAAATPLPGATPVPGLAQTLRQEHYQQLADRLGQAMAERLQSQIARGEWKLQMRLNPANLGRIDVELDMHTKGLDAMFRSENPLTRELMVQSMPKLKDTLSQSGMAVASVWVNSDAGRQSDGNPTPQRDRRDVVDTPTSAPVEIGTEPATKVKRNPDGFDVLA